MTVAIALLMLWINGAVVHLAWALCYLRVAEDLLADDLSDEPISQVAARVGFCIGAVIVSVLWPAFLFHGPRRFRAKSR